MSQVSRRSEVAYINGAPSTPGYLLALLRELSQCPRALTEIREIMLFIGKPKGRSMMISNATNPLKESRKNLY